MNKVYNSLDDEFEEDESYTGAIVMSSVSRTIKETTIKMIEDPKSLEEESEEEDDEEGEDEESEEGEILPPLPTPTQTEETNPVEEVPIPKEEVLLDEKDQNVDESQGSVDQEERAR